MKRIIATYSAYLLCLLAFVTNATVSFSVHAPKQVTQGNKFQITYELKDAEGSNFTPPEVEGASKLYGPALSTSYSSSWVNGKTSSSSSQDYSMVYKAETPGTYKVGAATIIVDGQKYTTKPFTYEILPSGQQADNSRQSNSTSYSDPMTQTAGKKVDANDIFVRIQLSKQHIYEQEAVVCTIKLFTKYQISQFMATLQPSFDGFLIEELPQSPNLNNVETLNGQRYMVADLKKCILYPQQSGKLTITSGNYDVTVVQYDTYRTMFGTISQPVERKLQVKSNSASVSITPLPEPKPASFSGAVGDFTISSSITPDNLKTNAAATYNLKIKGTGNLKYIKAPAITFPKQFDVYDPQNDVKASAKGGNMSGEVNINYTFIPQFAGKFQIPAAEFSFFNTSTKKYETLHTQEFNLNVDKGAGAPSSQQMAASTTDIQHIYKREMNLVKEHRNMVDSALYWLWFIIPAAIFVTLMLIYRRQLRQRADVVRMRTKRANKVARRRLKKARAYMLKNDSSAFYSETLSAIWGYLSDKLRIPLSELSRDNILSELENYGVDNDLTARVNELLDKCEFAQYAPQLSENDLPETLSQVEDLIGDLERTKRNK